MQRLKIALPSDLRTRLDAASAKSGQSVAEEIRSRVEASFAREAADRPTRDLVEGVALMAAEIERETGAAWHKHAGAHEALEWAIKMRLRELKPKGSIVFGDRPHATLPYDDPYQLGPIIEFRLRQYPDFTSSPTRRFMEGEHQRLRGENERLKAAQRGDQEKPDQPKKGGK
jgi:hypothetical protein